MWLCTTILNSTARKSQATTKNETLIKNNHNKDCSLNCIHTFPEYHIFREYHTSYTDDWKQVRYLIKVKTVVVYTPPIHLFKS